jgi:exosortase
MKPRTIIILVVTATILGLAYWPTLRWLVASWLSNDYYSHGFIVPVVSGFFVWTKRKHFKKKEPSIIGIFPLVLGVLLYILTFVLEIRLLGVFSLLSIITALVFFVFGVHTVRAILFPLVFLVFMIPAPFVPDIAYRLQEISVLCSSWLLKSFGLPIISSGPEISLENNVFTIGLPCSGINTFIALLALAAVYGYILTGPLLRRVILFIVAFPVAVAANILRITSVITVAYYFSVQTATGWYHDLSSPIFFVIAFLVLVLIGRGMKCRINYEMLRNK